ncbi:MAG: septation protein SepH, partial [Nocardioidaceae bacterium]
TPEAVATLAGVSVDKIMPFCVPVIAERQHVAETAQRSHVRRKKAEGPARRLAEVVAERLRGRGLDPESAEWDAWRRDDGRWTVRTTYRSGDRERAGTFVFDMAGRYSVADDDEAKWLTGEKQSSSHGPQPRGGRTGERRLAAVPDGDDLLSLSTEDRDESEDDLDAVMRAVQDTGAAPGEAHVDQEAAAEFADEQDELADEQDELADRQDELTGEAGPAAASPETAPEATPQEEPAASAREPESGTEPTPRKRRQRRASVPSWDEIMFGRDGSND